MSARIRAGDRAALARALSELERLTPLGRNVLTALPVVEPRIIGWTGSPGSGKSSLINAIMAHRRVSDPDSRLAVLAIDPTSPVSGGSVLGDRIRMDQHALDPGVFIRSVASHGTAGGLSPAALRCARLLAAAGFPEVHLETVGVGQNDVAIADLADVIVVVCVPHAGDRIQALKAGVLEIADIFAVNKSDLDGADASVAALDMAATPRESGLRQSGRLPRVIAVSARSGAGIPQLSALLDEQANALEAAGGRTALVRARRVYELRSLMLAQWEAQLISSPRWKEASLAVASGELDPLDAAAALEDFRR